MEFAAIMIHGCGDWSGSCAVKCIGRYTRGDCGSLGWGGRSTVGVRSGRAGMLQWFEEMGLSIGYQSGYLLRFIE